MAIYHLSSQVIKRSAGRSVVAAAAYRAGACLVDERTGLEHDYRRKHGCDGADVFAPSSAPAWMRDRAQLWNGVEQVERRKDAQLARELDIALPAELTVPQMKALVGEYVHSQFVAQGMVADVAYHHLISHNPHCHVLLTLRDIDGEGFGNKNRSWNQKAMLETWRAEWSAHANRALGASGRIERIDHRTLKAQGIERKPQEHLGPTVHAMIQRGELPDRALRSVLRHFKKQLKAVQREIRQLLRSAQRGGASPGRRPGLKPAGPGSSL